MSATGFRQWTAGTLVAAGDALGESALWDARTQAVYWLDLLRPGLNRVAIDGSGFRQTVLPMPPPLGMIALGDHPGSLFLTARGGLYRLDVDTGAASLLADPSQGQTDIVFNDGKVDRAGRLWLGTSHALESEPKGSLYMRSPDGSFRIADSGFPVSNGPAFSRNGSILYFSDSVGRQILAYDVPAAGLPLLRRRVFAAFDEADGVPDGLTVDAEDCLWCAHWGGACVTRFAPDGRRIGRVELPVRLVTSCAFAGPGLETLVVTSARTTEPTDVKKSRPEEGSLFSCRPGVQGLLEIPVNEAPSSHA
ncbi:MAG: SMP-30/gluconolactonase/LRE family protein [Alphaproteobacteria bacterium]|nr:SMP-30/gluconolactonase/LRE family protein [Alphaproteobacteria bacterium]